MFSKKILELRQKLKMRLVKKSIRTDILTNHIPILLVKKNSFGVCFFTKNGMNLDIFVSTLR